MEPRSTANSVDAELRAAAASFARPSVRQSLLQLATSFGPFLAGCAAMYVACGISPWLALALAVPTGAFMVRVFIVQHDCGHGSFLPVRQQNDRLGFVPSLLTFSPYNHWRRSDATHHATTGGATPSQRKNLMSQVIAGNVLCQLLQLEALKNLIIGWHAHVRCPRLAVQRLVNGL